MPKSAHDTLNDKLTATWVGLTIKLGILGLLLYLSFILVRPFISIAIWSIVVAVALYPMYDWLAAQLGGRRRLASALLTIFNLCVVIGPAAWLALGLIESFRALAEQLDLSRMVVSPPPTSVKSWPVIGPTVYQFWTLASSNLREALAEIGPQLKPLGSALLQFATGAGTGAIKFLLAIVVAGFLFPPAPSLVRAGQMLARQLATTRGEKFVELAGATIRAVSRGVIGISALQAFLAGLGLVAAGIPGARFITSIILILGILQIGPSIILIPLIVWCWMTMDTTTAILFSAYMIPVSLLDNVLRPLVMARGLDTPMLIILIGVIGGTVSYGVTGLFLGPIILAVIWELLVAWIREDEAA